MTVFFNGSTPPKDCESVVLYDKDEGVEMVLKDRNGFVIGNHDLAIVKSLQDKAGNIYLMDFPNSKLRLNPSL